MTGVQTCALPIFEAVGVGPAFFDYDGDGWTDILMSNDTVRDYLYRNQGDGRCREGGIRAGIERGADGVAKSGMGVDVGDIHVVTGDTDLFYWGAGTFASRGAVVAGNAIHAAASKVREKVLKMAGDKLEAAVEDLELVDGAVQVKGVPASAIPLGQLVVEANPLRGAVKPGAEPGLEATDFFGPERGTTASGVHAMIVVVDPDTCQVEIVKYVVVHDCGRVINPLILAGQIQGGVAQGIGNAFYEQLHFSQNGALLNASLMDYLLPTANDVPVIETDHVETPSPLNPLGVKGAGEAGAIPVGALFAQALENAYGDWGLEIGRAHV